MKKSHRYFEIFDLALGRFIALILGGAGILLLFVAVEARDSQDALLPSGIGFGLLFAAAAMFYWRITFVSLLQLFASGGGSH